MRWRWAVAAALIVLAAWLEHALFHNSFAGTVLRITAVTGTIVLATRLIGNRRGGTRRPC